MGSIEKLKAALNKAVTEEDFPDYLTADINKIIANPSTYQINEKEIKELTGLIQDYDPYGDVGCFSTAVSPEEIKTAIDKMMR